MAPPKSNTSRKQSGRESKKAENKKPTTSGRNTQGQARSQAQSQKQSQKNENGEGNNQIDVSATIPITLQQLLLNVFKTALLSPPNSFHAENQEQEQEQEQAPKPEEKNEDPEEQLDVKSLIQTIKSHLYNRDFDSAFADADEQLLRAYALRWSAARALGYAGLFKSMLKVLVDDAASGGERSSLSSSLGPAHVVCIGGGAGAEIVALAAAWRDLVDEGVVSGSGSEKPLESEIKTVSLDDGAEDDKKPEESASASNLSITAVDIADWSSIVKRLSSTILSPKVLSSSRSHPAPLITANERNTTSSAFNVSFKRLDVLSLSDSDLTSLYKPPTQTPTNQSQTNIVTLMFTLNELFSTSMPKVTSFLLRTTDLLQRGTILLVVDSPGSYSTLKLGKAGAQQERQYPMKFLLDHTLLSVAKGKWERLYSQDSRWWRRDAGRLWYEVGEGAGLEDMRFQIHVYRRV